jgi:glycosyltransferase involved in cell wall biosynthesis
MDDLTLRRELPLVSVLFITYNRLPLLRRTVETFKVRTSYPNLQLVIADDGSPLEVQRQIRELPVDEFALCRQNRGLGANANAGLARCQGDYILMLQDDWECVATSNYLQETVRVMQENPQIGLIKYYGIQHELVAQRPLLGSAEPCFPIAEPRSPAVPVYSDTPHVMSRAARSILGPYKEGCDMESCEIDYGRRFDAQSAYSAAIFPNYYNQLFVHIGAECSYRTTRMRYRVDEALQPAAHLLRRFPMAYRACRAAIRTSVGVLERIGLFR